MSESMIALLGIGALFAGFVDAVVGGGGLIQIPLLFSALPNHAPATLFGTNKIASIVGTGSAAIQYTRRIRLTFSITAAGAIAALCGAWLGARAVSLMDPTFLKPIILVLLVVVAIYTFHRKDFGTANTSVEVSQGATLRIVTIALTLGFYDGFFGPGTGSFFIFLLIRFLNMDFLRASATAKILNFATNLAAISLFASTGAILWKIGAFMAVCNLTGALIGSHMALTRGVSFVRHLFLFVVTMLIARLAWEILAP